LLANVAEGVVLADYRAFVSAVEALEARIGDYAAGLDGADREAAQQAWRDAMRIWQRAEVYQLGPAAMSGVAVGGQDLRDRIYSWPVVSRCRVDQEIVEQNYASSDFAQEAVNVRGLDALEYLLFTEASANACPPQNAINSDGSWQAVADLGQRRADFARTLAADLRTSAATLRDGWEPSGGDFVGQLSRAGQGSAGFESAHSGVNALSDAMFYLDHQTKDMKLAAPAGLVDCTSDTCPEKLESQVARFSKQEIAGNIEGFQRLFLGGPPGDEALGFDDLLVAAGAEELAQQMSADIDAALAAVAAIEEDSLADALANDLASVEALYGAVKAITDNLKSQFRAVLALDLPQSVEGDND
jgi:predicted lipoprotein